MKIQWGRGRLGYGTMTAKVTFATLVHDASEKQKCYCMLQREPLTGDRRA
jgi:hypothetical protein